MSTAILVAGMHRSGTSATTGALSMCGVALGSKLVPAAADNPSGYWESAKAVQIHENLLSALERSWDDVRELPDDWLDSDAAQVASVAIETLISKEFSGSSLWAVKDPRICRFVPLWTRVLGKLGIRPVVLFVVRRPSEVASSIMARNGWLEPLSELLWLRHVFEAEEASRGLRRCVVTYDEILADAQGCITRAASRLDIVLPDEVDTAGPWLRDFVNISGRHHNHDDSAAKHYAPTSMADHAYEILARIAANNDGWEEFFRLSSDFKDSSEIRSRYLNAVADSAWQLREKLSEQVVGIARVQSDLYAQIQWSEEAVVREQKLVAEGAETLRNLTIATQNESDLRAKLSRSETDLEARLEESRWLLVKCSRLETDLEARLEESRLLRVKSDLLQAEREAFEIEVRTLRTNQDALADELERMVRSRSWRLTRPFRWLGARLATTPPGGITRT